MQGKCVTPTIPTALAPIFSLLWRRLVFQLLMDPTTKIENQKLKLYPPPKPENQKLNQKSKVKIEKSKVKTKSENRKIKS